MGERSTLTVTRDVLHSIACAFFILLAIAAVYATVSVTTRLAEAAKPKPAVTTPEPCYSPYQLCR